MSAHVVRYGEDITLVWTRRDFLSCWTLPEPYVETVNLARWERTPGDHTVPGVYLGHDVDTYGKHAA